MRLILVRHGQTHSNTISALDTALPGADLDATGQDQVRMLADNFTNLTGRVPNSIYVSPLARTRQTARPLEERFGLTATVREGIREVIAGDLEMSTKSDDISVYLHTLLSWITGDLDARMPGGEDGWQTRARFGTVLNEALSKSLDEDGPDSTVVLVAHGALCRFIATTLSQDVSAELVSRYPMHNASTTMLEWKGHSEPWIGDRSLWHALTWSDKPIDKYHLTGEVVSPTVSQLREVLEPEK